MQTSLIRTLFLTVSVVISAPTLTSAQSVINGLPPPPPISDQNYPPNNNPAPIYSPPATSDQGELNFQVPNTLYRVFINSTSKDILLMARTIEPEAFVRPVENIIQAGLYGDRNAAVERVQQLASRGLSAQIMQIGAGGMTSVLPATQMDTNNPPIQLANNTMTPESAAIVNIQANPKTGGYFVVIPADGRDLPVIRDKIVSLGVTSDIVYIRQAPRGTHIAVGPFNNRALAERWNSYLRLYRFDARVYFGR
jgi:hypothetical protein